ncbi:MAG: LysM peptidoglycan-binding domain-containing protein, partial [Sinobacterium sp.]|nr:LysM peptidoglycan-binding domain-containing protein [Sinobacterium sp.]
HPIDDMPMPLSPHDSIWPRIQSGLTLKYVDHPSVQAEINWYARHPEYFKRVQKRASRYLYHIVDTLNAQDAPVDLALLPIVESAYEPFAYSHGQASGLWQFIPGTAGRFKLKRSWWQDERRDVVESTNAAIKYLKILNRYFDGDWELAIAAYNAGEGTVRRAIRKNEKKGLPTDFWHLDLPKETSAYVPKMIALSHLFRHPEKYNIELLHIPNQAYFKQVKITQQLDLVQAAELADITMDELYYLNAGLNRWATPPSDDYIIKIPIANADNFKANLEKLPSDQRITWHRYTIQQGDSLSTIAVKFKTRSDIIISVNNIQNKRIYAGKTLLIPMAKGSHNQYKLSQDQRIAKRKARKPKNGLYQINYHVKPADSFWSIANKYNVSVESLAKWNKKSPKDSIYLNEVLVIWSKTPQASNERSGKVRKITYKVRRGDSLDKIANKFNVKVSQITKWNKINSGKYIQPGQKLTLFVNVMDTY